MRVELEHPKLGRVEMPGVPVKLSATPGSVRHLVERHDADANSPHTSPRPSRSRTRAPHASGPLAGVRVLDLGAFIAGTFAPTILANFGADVIKVEGLDGDPFRTYGLGFIGHNRGKRGLAIDLKSPEGREAFFDLVRVSDVVLDNYRVGVRERLSIDYATPAQDQSTHHQLLGHGLRPGGRSPATPASTPRAGAQRADGAPGRRR